MDHAIQLHAKSTTEVTFLPVCFHCLVTLDSLYDFGAMQIYLYVYVCTIHTTAPTAGASNEWAWLCYWPAEPNAKWNRLSRLNLTQQTFAFTSSDATECSTFVCHNFTAQQCQQRVPPVNAFTYLHRKCSNSLGLATDRCINTHIYANLYSGKIVKTNLRHYWSSCCRTETVKVLMLK